MKTIAYKMLRKVHLASFTTILSISLIVNSIYFLCMCLLRSKAPLKHIQPIKDESWSSENNSTWTLFQHFCLYVIALLQKKKKKPIYRLPRWSLPYFVENANETSQQLKDNYLITTWIVNRASRATHANWVSWQMRVS